MCMKVNCSTFFLSERHICTLLFSQKGHLYYCHAWKPNFEIRERQKNGERNEWQNGENKEAGEKKIRREKRKKQEESEARK